MIIFNDKAITLNEKLAQFGRKLISLNNYNTNHILSQIFIYRLCWFLIRRLVWFSRVDTGVAIELFGLHKKIKIYSNRVKLLLKIG